MTAADECVVSDNINALKVLVDAGASTNNTLKLARANGRTEIREYLEASVKFQVEDLTRLIALLSTRSTSVPRVTSCVRTVQRGRR